MIKRRKLWLAAVPFLVLALALVGIFGGAALAQSDESPETLMEQQLALAAEQNPAPPAAPPTNVPAITFPLLAGVDDTTIGGWEIDPATNAFLNLFTGFQVWGMAYDPVNELVYFNNGSTLYSWPAAGGPVNTLGTITDAAGAAQSMVSLAFYNGQLYGTKNIANEAVWAIDTATRIATVFIDYVDADLDCGGLAVHQATGQFYCTNDDSTPHGVGLKIINPDASVTNVVAYPAGETDIDGLAVGDNGRAYLIEDESGASIHVYDLVGGAYVGTLNTPWATAEVFSGGAWVPQGLAQPSIALTKTVGTDPGSCATTTSISVPAGSDVTYCYEVTNTGTVTLTIHDLVDDQLGPILTAFPYPLGIGASAFLTQTATILTDTTNVATWTACNFDGAPGPNCADPGAFDVVTATATADVAVLPLGISLNKTVGTTAGVCATTDSITIPAGYGGTTVYYCYEVTNTGAITLSLHTLDDSELGNIFSNLAYDLGPGESVDTVTAGFNVSALITQTTVNTATWTASVPGAPAVTASDSATVTRGDPTGVALSGFEADNLSAAPLWLAGLLVLLLAGGAFILRRKTAG